MSTPPFVLDDREFQKSLRAYLDLRKTVDPKAELRRRAKNVGMRLVRIYKTKGVVLNEITAKVKSLGNRVKIRPKIRAKKGKTFQQMIRMELNARRSAKGFTATGWFPSVEKLGGNPKREQRPGGGPRRGKLIERLGLFETSETLVNQQPGAAHVQGKTTSLEQQALNQETADMVKYIIRKQAQAAKRNGFKWLG